MKRETMNSRVPGVHHLGSHEEYVRVRERGNGIG
jgi:hypothetical protein